MTSLKQKVVFIHISKLFSKEGTLLEKSNLDEMVIKFIKYLRYYFDQELAGIWNEFGLGGDVHSNYRVNVGAKYTF